VNGNGIYFSAKSPDQIVTGLTKVLNSITAKLGSGAAAATSTLNPVAGDNFAYVASYTTGSWSGNLEARTINTTTGAVSEAASWCVENIPASATVTTPCNGTMNKPGAIAARKIWTKGPSSATLNNFNLTGGDLSAADFNATKLSGLSQWALLSPTQKTAAVGDNIVDFLRGNKSFEDNAADPDDRLYRERQATLGDAVESQPAYIAKPTFSYLDSGYSAFKAANAGRAGTVYMGANDGMMHAFDSLTGDERWAYVPSMLIPNMWALAEKNYSTNHNYYANGSPVVSDVFIGGAWRTILVAGLNGGGRGYYALDVTNPTAPTLLWEFTPTQDNDLGYTFGKPVITKKADGTWVVLVTSGYNNIPDVSCTPPAPALQNAPGCVKYPRILTGNGGGYLYVLNAATGAKISKIGTGEGTATLPSGLAQIAAWADAPEKNNTATYTYGGDLLGNVWRFDINAGTVMKFAKLKDSGGAAQPITTRPELGRVLTSNGETYRVVFVGTGKYLENIDLTDTQQQTLYAIKDDDATTTLDNPRSFTAAGPNRMVEQAISTAGATRTATNNPVDFIADRGWFVNFPDGGERQNVASQLVLGTLIVPTTVPSNTVCAPGGTSWLNYFNYRTGGAVDTSTNQVSSVANAPIVGVNVIYIPDPVTGKPKPVVSVVTADNPTPTVVPGAKFSTSGAGFQKKRVIWRELVN
jgi:type IV pilus assembly protein PilY1